MSRFNPKLIISSKETTLITSFKLSQKYGKTSKDILSPTNLFVTNSKNSSNNFTNWVMPKTFNREDKLLQSQLLQ